MKKKYELETLDLSTTHILIVQYYTIMLYISHGRKGLRVVYSSFIRASDINSAYILLLYL
jgi:hypothetical protein